MTDAYVHVSVTAGEIAGALAGIAAVDEVSAAHVVTGEWDIIAQLDLDDPADLPRVVAEEIHAVTGVADTVTNVAYDL